MTEAPGPSGPQMSDRMQALLSAAAEETAREQRAVSTVLAELRTQVASLTEGVRAAASDATVERLGGVVSTVVADLRTSTSLLGQRIEALSQRVDAVAADTAAPTEQAAVRLAALAADVATQTDALERVRTSLDQLAGFPDALAALQRDVAGLHDRLQPLAEVRAGLGDLSARTSHSLEQLRPQLDGLQAKLDAIGTVPDTERLRDAVVDALSPRLERLEEAAAHPVVGPEALKAHFGDLRAAIDSRTGERFDEVAAALAAVEDRLGQVGERVADAGDAAGGVPAVAAEVARLHTRLDEVRVLRERLDGLQAGVAALQDDSTGTALTLGIASLRDDLEHLREQLAAAAPPSGEEVAGLVSQRVADRLVETLAPRIADVVLTRVSAALVNQLGEALSPRVRADTEAIVRTATADSERRVLAHVDEAVLALAEALLRRRRGGRSAGSLAALGASESSDASAPDDAVAADPMAPDAPAAEPVTPDAPAEPVPPASAVPAAAASAQVDTAGAAAERTQEPSRPAVTSSLAPPAPAPVPPPAAAAQDVPVSEPAAAEEAPETAAEDVPEAGSEDVAQPEQRVEEAPKKALPTVAVKVPAKAALKRAPAPVKKAVRPATKPLVKPILERTPDLPQDDAEPVRTTPRPQPVRRPATEPAEAAPPPAPPTAPPPLSTPPEPPKRKPWWRPGG